MAEETLAKVGLYLDELNKIRVLPPQTNVSCSQLQEECKQFTKSLSQFDQVVQNLLAVMQNLSKQVEKDKLIALGSRNMLKSVNKQREGEQQQLIALITEKQIELERLRIQHESLLREENDQKEYLQQFMAQ